MTDVDDNFTFWLIVGLDIRDYFREAERVQEYEDAVLRYQLSGDEGYEFFHTCHKRWRPELENWAAQSLLKLVNGQRSDQLRKHAIHSSLYLIDDPTLARPLFVFGHSESLSETVVSETGTNLTLNKVRSYTYGTVENYSMVLLASFNCPYVVCRRRKNVAKSLTVIRSQGFDLQDPDCGRDDGSKPR